MNPFSPTETPRRYYPENRAIRLPFLDLPADGHDLLVMNQHPDFTDGAIDKTALNVFNLDRP